MSQYEMMKKAKYLKEIEAMIDELKAEAENVRDSIKAEMLAKGVEEMNVGKYIIRWTPIISNRFDTVAFKKIYGDIYQTFTKPVTSKRFSIS